MNYKDVKDINDFSKLNLDSWESIKDNVYLRLMNTKYIDSYDNNIIHTKFLDLSCVMFVQEIVDNTLYSHILTKKDIARYKINSKIAYETAKENTRKNRKKRISTLRESIIQSTNLYPLAMAPKEAFLSTEGSNVPGIIKDISEEDENILVIKNKKTCFGSAYIVLQDVLDEVYSRLNDNFYVLPMSVHEIWCVKRSYFENKNVSEVEDDLLDLVENFNDNNNKSWQDILSYKLYYYIGDDGKKLMSVNPIKY